MYTQALKPHKANMHLAHAQLPCKRSPWLLQVLYVCLGTVLLFTLTRYIENQCNSKPNQLISRRWPEALALTSHSASRQQKAAVGVQVVVPDVQSYTANVLPEVAKAVAQLEQQGQGKKVIAMSLYGDNPRYTLGAIENALLAKRDWTGWTYRVYHGEGVPADVLQAIQLLGGELVDMTTKASQGNVSSTFWRFLAFTDPTVTRVICRDTDSRLTPRDRAAVSEWVKSGYLFHMMHDHPRHHTYPVLAGMFGAVNGLLHPRLILKWFQQDQEVIQKATDAESASDADSAGPPAYKWFADQRWLRQQVWPLVQNYTLSHSSFNCGAFGEAKSKGFPVQRISSRDFVGNVYSIKTKWQGQPMIRDNRTAFAGKCPMECRRKPAWDTC